MITKIINGTVLSNGEKFQNKSVYFKDGRITAVTEENLPFDTVIDADGNYVSAGFIDIHVHGGGGYEFMDGGKTPIVKAANLHLKHGTTSIFPTSLACSEKTLCEFLDDLREVRKSHSNILGAHLEGPYFSAEYAGAQNPEYIKPPKKEEYLPIIENYGDLICRWDFAPELYGSDEFCRELIKNGIVASVGHSSAVLSDVESVYNIGARLLTHFYCAMSTVVRKKGFRFLGVTESGYYFDDMNVEIISDGCHLPSELLKFIIKQKNIKNICLVTDAMRGAGMPDGRSYLGRKGEETPCIIEDGVAKLCDRSAFAGSVATADRLVRTMVKSAGLPIEKADMLMTENPARIMGLKSKGSLETGKDADIIIFDDDVNIKNVILSGEEISIKE